MGLESLPVVAPTASKPARTIGTALLRMWLALLGCMFAYTWISIALAYSRSSSRKALHVAPLNAQNILDECAALYTVPSVPSNFGERTQSDRYDPDAVVPVLITNATIWTGNKGGTEVIPKGEIFLDKGIVKYVGDRAPESLVNSDKIRRINAQSAWVTPAIVDMHSHLGVYSAPALSGAADGNSHKGLTQPWLRSLDGLDTRDLAYERSIAGGVGTSLVLPGSLNAIGGQAFVIKLRETKERSPLAKVLEPPYNLLNGTRVDPSIPPRWRHMKHATGENPSRGYQGTRMDTIWAYRSAYNEARKLKLEQDAYCAKAQAHQWNGLPAQIPKDLQWEALVDVLRGKVKVNVHIYETVDFSSIVGLSNEFEFPIAAFHHAHEAYLVPDVIKKAWGPVTPGAAIFATNARYKREAYRGSEFAAKILHDNGIRVAMKSDHPVLDSRYLLREAAQAHYFGLDAPVALSAVTTTPAELIGMSHRIGYLRTGYDSDLVIWDSHPLALGATPQQVWIDGIPQLSEKYSLTKSEEAQEVPSVPEWDQEIKAALKYQGLPPLDVPKEKRMADRVVFLNVGKVFQKDTATGRIMKGNGGGWMRDRKVVVEGGKIACVGLCYTRPASIDEDHVVDLEGGWILPGLTTYGGDIGTVEIRGESTTNDGSVGDLAQGTRPEFLEDVVIKAADGVLFGGRDTLLAYRSGVTTAVAPPHVAGVLGGLSTALYTGAAHKLDKGAIVQRVAALHVTISAGSSTSSVSSQIASLRKALTGGLKGDAAKWYGEVAEGKLPLVVEVDKVDHIASLIELKAEIESQTNTTLRVTLSSAAEAHILAAELASAKIGVLQRAHQYPADWDKLRTLPGPPLSPKSAIRTLLDAGVVVGLEISEAWEARNTRFDLGWAALDSNSTLSHSETIELGSSNIERLLGLEPQFDLVAYKGGDAFQYSSQVAAVISPARGFVDVL